jgi:hypothetical protein
MDWKLPLVLAAMLLSSELSSARAEGDLDTIRSDVRSPPPESVSPAAPPSAAPSERPKPSEDGGDHSAIAEEAKGNLVLGGLALGAVAALSPYWLPRALMHDESCEAHFPRFPYDNTPGYLESDAWLSGFTADKVLAETLADATGSPSALSGGPDGDPTRPPKGSLITLSLDPSARRWGGQFRADYANEFDNLTGIGGQLILETTSRWGVDTSAQYLRERIPGDGLDHLMLGDCNLVYRFAQSPRAQMRMGLGANWLNDSTRTDLGCNFTYGGDFFPCKPWVLSSAIDWGTLGHAGLFRFRTTAGVIFNRFESYVGYEYLDVGTTQGNFLIGGVRVWF